MMAPSSAVSGLAALILMTFAILARSQEDVNLDPHAPNTCSREVQESRWLFINISMSCWRTEITNPPCRDGFWRSGCWDYWRRHSDCQRHHHHHHHHHRHKRQAESGPGLPGPTSTRASSTTTRPTWPTTTDVGDDRTGDLCYRRTLGRCWFIREQCVWVDTTEHYCCHGYEPDGIGGCRLEIECTLDNGGCDQVCRHDDVIGHHCSCFKGYRLVNETTCLDIDECLENNGGCSQVCTNLPGSYYCACRPGYMLTDPHVCTEINECELSNGGCDHTCVNTDGSFYCECEEGFNLVNGSMCADLDECSIGNGGCSDLCVNEYGAYRCECPTGYSLDTEGYDCVRDPVIGEPNVLPVKSIEDVMSEPLGYGLVTGGFVLLVIMAVILACVIRRYCCLNAVITAKGDDAKPKFMVGSKTMKKKTFDIESDLGEKPAMGYDDGDSINFDIFGDDEDDLKKKVVENDYTAPPSLVSGDSEGPPPYFKDDDEICSVSSLKSCEKPDIIEDADDHGCDNPGFDDEGCTKDDLAH